MKAIAVHNMGAEYRLNMAEFADPVPGADEVLIKTAAAGVNRADLLQAKGKYPPPPGASDVLGMEIAGEIVSLGRAVTRWRLGDKVCALLPGGGYAGLALANERCVLPVPDGMVMADAAALPEAFFTVWTNLFDTAELNAGESVLIHGGASGIGTTAVQLCTARGITAFVTAKGADRCRACEALGAARAIDYSTEDFVTVVREATGGRGVNVILDMVGGDYIEKNFAAAAPLGRIVNIAFQQGSRATVNFAPMMQKRLTLTATTLRGRNNEEKGAISDALLKKVWPLLAAGKIKPVIDGTFPLAEAGAAHARMEKGGHVGKILLTL